VKILDSKKGIDPREIEALAVLSGLVEDRDGWKTRAQDALPELLEGRKAIKENAERRAKEGKVKP
jgi:hypothetical protein